MRNNNAETDIDYLKTMIYYCNQTKITMEQAKKYSINEDDSIVVDALAMNIGHIGEQLDANKLSKEVQNQYQNID